MTDGEYQAPRELDIDEWEYEVKPKYVRFRVLLPDGEKYLTLDPETWDKLNSEFHNTITNARPIDDQLLVMVLQQLPNLRGWSIGAYDRPEKAVTLVNIAKRADGHGYILRIYERAQDREWNITTWGEWDALQMAVQGRR